MRVLLDTCALVWFALNDKQLSAKARNVVESFDTEVFVSAASAWEISTKARLGKWPGADELVADLETIIRELGFTELPISVRHADNAGMLPGPHKDPFDRMLIAQSWLESLPIVSSDRVFDDYLVRRVW